MLNVINSNASTNEPTKTQGLFSLVLNSNDQRVNTTLSLPRQTIELVSYRIEMTSDVTALAAKYCYLDVDWLSPNQLVDNNPEFSLLLLPLDYTLTFAYGLSMPVYLSKDIPERFDVRIRDSTGGLLAGLVSAVLVFKINYGHI